MGKEFLGRGQSFPFRLDPMGKLRIAEGEEKIQQSIVTILGTARGERVMRPQFGSRLHELVFKPINASTKSLVVRYVSEALQKWERRIELLSVNITEADTVRGRLLLDIEYKIKATNSAFNLVFPFYLQEGRNVAEA